MNNNKVTLNVQSETGRLEAVMLHYPGAEVENMTPKNAQRALYSDILNLSIAQKEYEQMYGVLKKHTKVFEVRKLLTEFLKDPVQKEVLLRKICTTENVMQYFEYLMQLSETEVTRVLIEGLPAKINSLTEYLKDDYYALLPLYNFYFTRDACVTIGNNLLVCNMANNVRARESHIVEAIFNNNKLFDASIINANNFVGDGASPMNIEGGDVLIVNKDILLIGNGSRTSSQAIDSLITQLCKNEKQRKHVIVQQLPHSPESFIHLDMVFTLLDNNTAMVYKPLILENTPYKTIHIQIDNGKVTKISTATNIPSALKKLGVDIEPIICGGKADEWDQEREQWHSGANFLSIAPGKVMSYSRNIHTLEELNKNGFEITSAWDVINDKYDVNSASKCVITIDGSELPRGGGGARCMTMPLRRKD
ncbi:MAG TPA: arginine deiminase family protein [Dysgonamonadaceae bacterium]|nr:arginine deiminase family protein [Dysgonamonadaceae bacterium]